MIYDVSEKEIPQQRIESNDEQLPQLRSYTGDDVSVFIRSSNLPTQLYICMFIESQKPNSPERNGHMNIYINKDARRGSSRHNQRYRFPVARYNRRRLRMFDSIYFSFNLILSFFEAFYGPFMHFMPRVPIFADRRTKQTLIYSQTGGSEY
jgi:hypothetical protein